MDPLSLIDRVAREQDGVVTAAQAADAGLTRHQIATLCRSGRWRRVAIGVYAVRQMPDGGARRAQIRAAVASLGPGACAVLEADGRARSPLETRVRLRCVDGGVAPDEVGYQIRDEYGYIIAEADLAWLQARIIAEADGAGPHGLPDAVYSDRRRQNTLANAGWLVLRFTWADTLRPEYIPHVVVEALRLRLPTC